MGNFFTSTQIYNNEKLGREKFIENFCSKMAEEGYVPCDDDDSEIAYILRFADNCNWVTITSEAYEQGNAISHKDTGRIAKMLGTTCVNTVVIDSDCAILELYDKNGKKADTFTIGRADDYFGDDIPQPSEKIWKSFLSKDSSWEQFTQICSSDEVFVEDGLSKLAPIIGMDAGNIIFSAEDADVSDINAICINFRQSNVKKDKKLTLKAAFIKVFGEALEPLGYKKVKGTKPYFVRVIDNEIIQIISIFQRKGALRGEVEFNIVGDVFSVYSRYFDLKKKLEDGYLLLSNFRVYSYKLHEKDYDSDIQRKLSHFKCKDDNASIISEMKNAFDTCEKWLFPFINYIDSIDEYCRFLMLWHFPLIKKELLYLKVDNYAELINEVSNIRNEMYRKCIELNRDGYTEEDYEKRIKRREVVCSELIADIKEIHENNGLYNEYKAEEEAVKEKNLEILKAYGLYKTDTSSNCIEQPKKLTLNAAFKQIFGEALEPYGFKTIKGRYPYLVRVINNEILHIITFAKVRGSETKFIVYSGVATIYRNEINFDQSILFNTNWLSDTKKYWMKNLYDDPDGKSFFEKQSYYSFDDNETLLSALELALRHLKKYVLPVLDSVNSLKECIKYFWCYNSNLHIYSFDEDFHNEDKNNEGLLYFVIDDHSDMMNEFAYWSDLEKKYAEKYGSNLNSLENYIDTINDFRIQQIQKRDKIYNNASDYEKTMEEIKNRMKKNKEYIASKI